MPNPTIKTIDEAITNLEDLKKSINANDNNTAKNTILRVITFLNNFTKTETYNQLSPETTMAFEYLYNRALQLKENLMQINNPEEPKNKRIIQDNLTFITDQLKAIRVILNRGP
jgi:hypothetical protein